MTTPAAAATPAPSPSPGREARPAPAAVAPEDANLGAATRSLVDAVAPGLGLAPGDVVVHTGLAGRPADEAGAHGLAGSGAVWLGSGFSPVGPKARGLVAHELAHLAQQRRRPPGPAAAVATAETRALAEAWGPAGATAETRALARAWKPAVDVAEAEARSLAEAAEQGRPLWQPRAWLAPGAIAADTGAATLPKAATNAPTTTAPGDPAAAAAAKDPKPNPAEVEVGLLRGQMADLVKRRYDTARKRIVEYLSGFYVSGDDARECLRILDPMPFLVARAVVSLLDGDQRVLLAQKFGDDHHRSFPVAALAALAAMPPMLLRKLDADSVEGLDNRGFGSTEARATTEVLQGLRPPVLEALVTGKRGPFFTDLLTGGLPLLGTSEASALRKALDEEKGKEKTEQQADSDKRVNQTISEALKLLVSPTKAQAIDALVQLAALAPGGGAAPDPNAKGKGTDPGAGAAGPAAGSGTAEPPTRPDPPDPGPGLRRAVRALEARGAIAKLLDALGNFERWAGGPHATQLITVLAGRDPVLNLSKAESLLSYGFTDWVIFDSEARYAYVLVRSVSIADQDRWKYMDNGKWFARLEDNIPAGDVVQGYYRGVGSRADAFAPGATKLKNNSDLADASEVVRTIDATIRQQGVGPINSVELVRKILAVGRTAGSTTPVTSGANRRKVEIVVDRLDALGHIDRIFDKLPDAYLYNEMWRGEILELMAARDPRQLERSARRLLEYGLFDWAVTAREAWIAFYLVRSLDKAARERFEQEDPDRWSRIQSEMTDKMRASSATTLLGGKQTFETRDRLRDRLRDDKLWKNARASELRSFIIQLYALDDRRWVFLRSKELPVESIKALDAMADDLGLFHSSKRPTFKPESLESTSYLDEGPFQTIETYLKYLVIGVKYAWLNRASLPTDTVEVADLDLRDLAWTQGGDLGGARVADQEKHKVLDAPRRSGPPRKKGNKPLPDFSINPRAGLINLRLPKLELAGFNRPFTNMSLRTGRITLTDIDLEVSFSDRGYHRPVGAIANFGRADVNDAVAAGDGFPGGLLAANHLSLAPLGFRSGATGMEDLEAKGKDNWIPIPVLDPFMHVLSHIVAFMGTIPGLTSSLPLVNSPGLMAVSPFIPGGPVFSGQWAVQSLAAYGADFVATPVAEGVLGLITDGVFRKPRTVDERAKDAIAMMRSYSLSVGSLEVSGVSLGGIQQVESVKVSNLVLGFGRSRPTALRAERSSIDRRLKDPAFPADRKPDLDKRMGEIKIELDRLEPLEKELDTLEARHRWDKSSLGKSETARLVELSNLLRQTAGGAVDVGSIAVGPLSGVVNSPGIDIGAIHAEAQGPSRIGEYLPPRELVKRFQQDRRPVDPRELAKGVRATADVAGAKLRLGAKGEPALRLELGVPTVREVQQQIDAIGADPRFGLLKAQLQAWITPGPPITENAGAAVGAAVASGATAVAAAGAGPPIAAATAAGVGAATGAAGGAAGTAAGAAPGGAAGASGSPGSGAAANGTGRSTAGGAPGAAGRPTGGAAAGQAGPSNGATTQAGASQNGTAGNQVGAAAQAGAAVGAAAGAIAGSPLAGPAGAVAGATAGGATGATATVARRPSKLERLYILEAKPSEPADLDGKPIEGARTRAEEQELQGLRADARRFFSVTVQTLQLGGITATFKPETLGLGIDLTSFEATGISGGTTRVARVTGEHVGAGLALDATGGGTLPAGAQERLDKLGLPDTHPGATLEAGKLSVEGVESPGLDAKRLSIAGLKGAVVPDGNNLNVTLHIDSADLEGITYQTPTRTLYARGTSHTGPIAVKAKVVLAPTPTGGIAGYTATQIVVESLGIDYLTADRVGMDVTSPAPGYSIEATSGTLRGIWVQNLVLGLTGKELTYQGAFGVEQLEAVRLLVISRAVKGSPTVIKGRFDSPPVADHDHQAGAIRAQLLEGGGKTFDLQGVTLTEGEVTTPDGRVTIRKAGLNGHVDLDPNGLITFSGVGPLDIDVSSINWALAGGRLTAAGSTKLERVEASGTFRSEDEKVGADGKKIPAKTILDVKVLKIPKITSDDLHYKAGAVDLHLGKESPAAKKKGKPPLEIRDVVARDLHFETGKGFTGAVKAGKVLGELGGRVAGTRSGVAGAITDALFVKGEVGASSIDLTFHEKGRIVARVRGGHADVGLGETEAADTYHGSLDDLDTGVVDIHDDVIDIGTADDPLKIGTLTLDKMSWNFAGKSGFGMQLDPTGGKVTATGVKAQAQVQLEKGKFKRLVLKRLSLPSTVVNGLHLRFSDATIKLDKTQVADLGPIELKPSGTNEGFVVEPKASGPGLNLVGQLNLANFSAPAVSADIAGALKGSGDIAGGELTVDFMGVEGLFVRLKNPSITNVLVQLAGDKAVSGAEFGTHQLRLDPTLKGPDGKPVYRLKATELTYEDTNKKGTGPVNKLTVKDLGISGIDYLNTALGLHVTIRNATAPGDTLHDFLRGPKGGGEIPELDIDDAFAQIDLPKFLSKVTTPSVPTPAPAGETPKDALVRKWNKLANDLRPNADLVNALNGSLGMTITAGDKAIPIKLTFVNGAINVDELLPTLKAASDKNFTFTLKDGSVLYMEHVSGLNILLWDLNSGEVTQFQKTRRIGLQKFLEPKEGQDYVAGKATADPSSNQTLKLSNIVADLSLKNPKPIPLDLGPGNEIVLAPNAIANLKVLGSLGGTDAGGAAQPGALVPISLANARVQSTKFALTRADLSTGTIDIDDVNNSSLTFSGLTPQTLGLNIRRAVAKNIHWSLK